MHAAAATFLAATSFLSLSAFAAGGPDPSGVWMRDDGNARVRIAPCGEKICATNLWIKDTSKGEAVGDRLIMTLKPKAGNVLEGTAFDEKRDSSYSVELAVQKDAMEMKGCIVGGLLCRNVNWARVD